ncbi:hypothetical protein DFH06DRAFT_1473780 [Mycena polygramma]|nr:hypothetical protein DFH06DRAFT_1473780 [Mycena polygramma]
MEASRSIRDRVLRHHPDSFGAAFLSLHEEAKLSPAGFFLAIGFTPVYSVQHKLARPDGGWPHLPQFCWNFHMCGDGHHPIRKGFEIPPHALRQLVVCLRCNNAASLLPPPRPPPRLDHYLSATRSQVSLIDVGVLDTHTSHAFKRRGCARRPAAKPPLVRQRSSGWHVDNRPVPQRLNASHTVGAHGTRLPGVLRQYRRSRACSVATLVVVVPYFPVIFLCDLCDYS